jgi:septum formation protein
MEFDVMTADLDESSLPEEKPVELATRLAASKARAVADRIADGSELPLIIAADTVVALGDTLMGKPADAGEARAMLEALCGCDHHVISAVSVFDTASGAQRTRVSDTLVRMRDYTSDEVDAYVATGDPFDKAGAYAIQHPEFRPVASLQGCMAGVMGLPLGVMRDLLGEFGVEVAMPLARVCQAHTHFACCQ